MTAKPIMVQGTMSGVGKSLLVAGLCRVFAQDGLRVAPFKSQNMALNSAITATGDEMGRAQVVQAEAAGIPPEAAMNPILLKPTTDVGSQVIVNGQVLGTMSAREYFAYKKQLVPEIRAAYDDLAQRFDVIVIEGAGSPAEINLKDDDIVNMGMAKMVNAPVLLAGDIDRGGVFAQLIGTIMLLDDDERSLVKATIVNKFRGDATILEPGLDILRERTGVPVAGVVPYTLLDIDDEDSLSDRLGATSRGDLLDIAVVRLPRVSNFTDFISLDAIEGVGVRYVSRPADLGAPDMIVVPGTKSTISDLKWLRESGLEAAICKAAAAGTVVFGICGGFQMLGAEVSDPHGVEGGGDLRGMGLLPVRTVFAPEKHQTLVVRELGAVEGPLAALSGVEVEGYEIHMGETETVRLDGGGGSAVLRQSCFGEMPTGHFASCGTARGTTAPSVKAARQEGSDVPLFQAGNVYGSYIHGFFDRKECAQAVVSSLLAGKGLDGAAVRAVDMEAYKEEQYDKLAQVVRESLDMDLIYRILEEGA